MKKIIIGLIALIAFARAFGQSPGNDTSKYIYYRYTYGNALDRYWAKKVLLHPADTIFSKDGTAIIAGVLYVGNGIKWTALGSAANFANTDLSASGNRAHNWKGSYDLTIDSIRNLLLQSALTSGNGYTNLSLNDTTAQVMALSGSNASYFNLTPLQITLLSGGKLHVSDDSTASALAGYVMTLVDPATGLVRFRPATGAGGSPNTSVGGKIRVAINGTNNVKSLDTAWGIKPLDSTTVSNVIKFGADSGSVLPVHRLADSTAALRTLVSTKKDNADSVGPQGYASHGRVQKIADSLSAIILPKLDSVRKSDDTVYEYYANNTKRPAFRDSLGWIATRKIVGPVDTPGIAKRNDAGTIVRLANGVYFTVWTVFPGPNTADVSTSLLYGSISIDGKHWGPKYVVMSGIAGLGPNTPSLKVKPNGDVFLFFNIKYNTAQLTSTLAYAVSTNNGASFTFGDSILKNQNNYFYTKSDCIESSPGNKRWFIPFGQITNRGSAYFIGKFMYSDDFGSTWTVSSQVFLSPDSVVNEPGIYILPRFPKTFTAGEFVRYYFTTASQSRILEYQSIDNGSTWSTSFNVMGMQVPYSAPAFKVFDGGLRMIAVVNGQTGGPNQPTSRTRLILQASGQEGHSSDIGNALSTGHQWRDLGPLVYADSNYTVFEPCIYIDSANDFALIGISKFDSIFSVASWEVIKIPLFRVRGPTQQTYTIMNIKPSGLEFEANQGFFNVWNDLYGYADNHLSVKTLSGSSTDANLYLEWKNHNNGTAAGMGFFVFPAVDAFSAYYSHLLWIKAGSATSNIGYLGVANNAGSILFDVGPLGSVGIGNQFSNNAWLKLAAPSSTMAQLLIPSGTTRTTVVQGQLQDSLGILNWDSSGSARRWLLTKQWADNLYAPIGVGGNPFSDASALVKNSADATKLLRFSAANQTTGTTNVISFPNTTAMTAARIDAAQTFTGDQTFSNDIVLSSPSSSGANDSSVTWDPVSKKLKISGKILSVTGKNGVIYRSSDTSFGLGGALDQNDSIAGAGKNLALGTTGSKIDTLSFNANTIQMNGYNVILNWFYADYSGQTAFVGNTINSSQLPTNTMVEFTSSIKVNSITTNTIHLEIVFTDLSGASQTITLTPANASSSTISTTGTYVFPAVDVYCKSGTGVTIQTAGTTGGSMNYEFNWSSKKIR